MATPSCDAQPHVKDELRWLRVELGPRNAELDASDGACLDDERQIERRLHGSRLDLEVLQQHVPAREAGRWGPCSVRDLGREQRDASCQLPRD